MQKPNNVEELQDYKLYQLDEYLTIAEAQQKLCKNEFEKDLMKKMLNNAKRKLENNKINKRKRGEGKTSETEFPRSEIESLFAQKISDNLSNAEPNAEVENLKNTIDLLKINLSNAEARQLKLLELLQTQQELTKNATNLNELIQIEKNSLVLRLNEVEKFDWTWKFWLWFRNPSKND